MAEVNNLCQDVFPWISKQAIRLGQERQDNRFAQLGGELFILSQQIYFSREMEPKLVKVAGLVNTACTVSYESVCAVCRNVHPNLPLG